MSWLRRWLRRQLLEAVRLELLAVQLEQQLARRRLVALAEQLEQLGEGLERHDALVERNLGELPSRVANLLRTGSELWQ